MPLSLFLRYGSAVVALLLATLLRLSLDPILGDRAVYPLYYGVVMLIAWYAGSGPAGATLLASTLLADYLFVSPRGSLEFWNITHETEFSLYIAIGLLIILLIRQFQTSRKSEARVRQQASELEAIYQSAPVGLCVLDTQLRFVRVNERLAEINGIPLAAHLGKTVREVLPQYVSYQAELLMRGVISTGKPILNLEVSSESKMQPGLWCTVVMHWLPLRDKAGKVIGINGVVEEITERKRAEQALQQANRLLDTVVNTTHLLMACLDVEFNFIWVNRTYAAADGREPEFFPGKNHFALYPNDENLAIFRRVVETGASCFFQAKPSEYKDHPERGTTYWDWGLIPIKDATGKVERLVFTLLDVSARIRAEAERERLLEQLAEADRRKDEFLATLAHELRNPLAPITNAFALIRRGAGTPEVIEQALGMGERQVGQLVRLVDDLLDISRISRGKITLRKARVSLRDIVQSALETARPRIEAGGHWLTVELPEAPVYLEADLTRLAQAVANLLINAAKFTAPGGQIQLRARCEGDEVAIVVQDNGIGIAAEQLPKVFGLFAQLEQPPGQRREGLGIGLALVKSLVELHGGRVAAASPGRGQGSTFTLRLPCAAAMPAKAPSIPGAATDTAPPQHARRVLIADDDADVADSMALLLRSCGHEVVTAYDGVGALAAARTFQPEVVLLDLGMPGLDGYEVARRLRQLPELHATRLIALTGWGQEQDRQRSRAAGFDQHLVKPVDLPTLEALLGDERSVAGTRQPTEVR